MKISLSWLNEFIDVSEFIKQPQDLAEKLTAVGFEVESIVDRAADFKNVVVGQIQEMGRHPGADRLTVCQVDVGPLPLRQIVCGANNHRAYDKVVVALPGAILPGNFAIQLSKIRNVESQGMLCSAKELGLSAESEGIMILPETARVGNPFANEMGQDDIVFDVNISPNRSDAFSHFGLARELSAVLERPLKKQPQALELGGSSPVQVTVSERQLCSRYCGLTFKNVEVGPSPQWLRSRLMSVDMNSVNNVVDITNFVMMELGQPLHAFDRKQLRGDQIHVGLSRPHEKFVSFDGTEIELTGHELMIRDQSQPLVLAGIVGGPDSGITEHTTDVFLEAAEFTPETVRKTARFFGVETDSAYRFSRGVDADMIPKALARAHELLQSVCGAELVGTGVDIWSEQSHIEPILIAVSEVAERLGYDVDQQDFLNVMTRIGSSVTMSSTAYSVTPPLYRRDLTLSVDLIEEFGRLNGFSKIPEAFPVLQAPPQRHDKEFIDEQRVRRFVASEGFHQVINYGFLNPQFQAQFLGTYGFGDTAVELKNPLNADLSVMRRSLLPGLFKNVTTNIRYGVPQARLFEVGSVFTQASDYLESLRLAMVIFGQTQGLWESKTVRPPLYDLKTAFENVLTQLQISRWSYQDFDVPVPGFLHPGQSAVVKVEGRDLGVFGTLHPQWIHQEKLNCEVAVLEIDVASLMRGQPRRPRRKKLLPYPFVHRDLSFLVSQEVNAIQVETVIVKAAGPLLHSITVFDVFSGENLPTGVRSLGFRMVFQDPQGTPTEEVLQTLQTQIIASVKQQLGVAMR